MAALETAPEGLGENEVERRAEVYGANEVGQEKQHGPARRLFHAVRNPLVVLLTALAVISYATGDLGGGSVMLLMVVLGVSLRFVQETRADTAAAKLRAMIRVTATVVRDGKPVEVPLRDLVPGDVVKLAAGDMIPADVRVVSSKDLFVTQASLTGESLPVEKVDAPETAARRLAAGTEQRLLPGHQRRERHRHGRRRRHRGRHLLRQHGPEHDRPARSRPASTAASTGSPG